MAFPVISIQILYVISRASNAKIQPSLIFGEFFYFNSHQLAEVSQVGLLRSSEHARVKETFSEDFQHTRVEETFSEDLLLLLVLDS